MVDQHSGDHGLIIKLLDGSVNTDTHRNPSLHLHHDFFTGVCFMHAPHELDQSVLLFEMTFPPKRCSVGSTLCASHAVDLRVAEQFPVSKVAVQWLGLRLWWPAIAPAETAVDRRC